MEDKGKEIVTKISDLVTFRDLGELREYAEEIAATKFTPLSNGADVMVAILTGQELGFAPMFSANNIYPINSRGTLGVHAINALLSKAGVIVKVLRDYEPCVQFVMKGDDNKAILVDETGKEVKRDEKGNAPSNIKTYPVPIREGFVDEEPKDYEVKGRRIINYKTIIEFTRKVKQPDGTWKESTAIGSFSYQQAVQAGLADKDNWKNYPKEMTYSRALSFGARRIADDVLGGMYETSEYADAKNINYSYEEGTIKIIHPEKPEPLRQEIILPAVEDIVEVQDTIQSTDINKENLEQKTT